MNTGTQRSSSDLLVEAISAAHPEDMSYLNQKMGTAGFSLTDAECDYFRAEIAAHPHPVLAEFLAVGIWDGDRAFLHVMTRSFNYLIQIIEASSLTNRKHLTAIPREILQQAALNGFYAGGKTNSITDAEYDETSRYLNALNLIKATYLNTNVVSRFDEMQSIIIPLMQNQDIIEPAVGTIVSVWEAIRAAESSRYLTVTQVLEIARNLAESPEIAPRLIAFAGERGYFDSDAAMEYASTPSRALSNGVL